MGHSIAISGGASGQSLATALRFAGDGWTVGLLDTNGDALHGARNLVGQQTDVYAHQGDVTDEETVHGFFSEVVRRFGPPQCVLNAAGNMPLMLPTLKQPLDGWQRIVDVHLRGTYLCCRGAASAAQDAGQPASIVNVSSIVGEVGFPMRSEYGPAKAAIEHLTRTLAIEWASDGIRVNCIAPGYIRTPSFQGLSRRGVLHEDVTRRRIPLGRFGEPEEFADLAHFLLVHATYMTGTIVSMDGGWTAYGYL